eukprot:4851220-Prymnesium_polylepis.1
MRTACLALALAGGARALSVRHSASDDLTLDATVAAPVAPTSSWIQCGVAESKLLCALRVAQSESNSWPGS